MNICFHCINLSLSWASSLFLFSSNHTQMWGGGVGALQPQSWTATYNNWTSPSAYFSFHWGGGRVCAGQGGGPVTASSVWDCDPEWCLFVIAPLLFPLTEQNQKCQQQSGLRCDRLQVHEMKIYFWNELSAVHPKEWFMSRLSGLKLRLWPSSRLFLFFFTSLQMFSRASAGMTFGNKNAKSITLNKQQSTAKPFFLLLLPFLLRVKL